MGADFYDRVQYSVWDYFVEVSLLGRNDNLSEDDPADGDMVNDHLDKKSVLKRKRGWDLKEYKALNNRQDKVMKLIL